MPNRIAIFTDLDGTLIRHEDYSFAPVKSLLRKLQLKDIPVILTSSKTRAEVEHYRVEMKLADPFVVENGGAIVIPNKLFRNTVSPQTPGPCQELRGFCLCGVGASICRAGVDRDSGGDASPFDWIS